MRNLTASLRRTWQELGPRTGLLYLLHRLLQAISAGHARVVPYTFYAQPIGRGSVGSVRDDPNAQVDETLPGDEISRCFPRPADVNLQRWQAGSRCFHITVKDQFGGHIWISRDTHNEDEVRCRYVLPGGGTAVWDFDVYVEPRLRMGRTLARLWKAVDADLARQGVRWSFSRISRFNPGSVAAHQRLGAQPVGHATFIVMGQLEAALLPGSLLPQLTWASRNRPEVQLEPPPNGH